MGLSIILDFNCNWNFLRLFQDKESELNSNIHSKSILDFTLIFCLRRLFMAETTKAHHGTIEALPMAKVLPVLREYGVLKD